jgi:hypothetical protein
MPSPRKRRRKPAPHVNRRYKFTREDCQRGYQAALVKCMQDWDLYAWFYYRVRGWYRGKKRSSLS